MNFPLRARLPPAPYPSQIPTPPPRDEAAERMKKAKERRARRRKIVAAAAVIIALVAISSVYYYIQYSPYETAPVSTTTSVGTINGVSDATVALGGSSSQKATPQPNARIEIATSYGSFSTFISCWPAPYKTGEQVKVTVVTLRNGGHQYSTNLFCNGGGIGVLNPSTTSSTSTTSTTSTTTTATTGPTTVSTTPTGTITTTTPAGSTTT